MRKQFGKKKKSASNVSLLANEQDSGKHDVNDEEDRSNETAFQLKATTKRVVTLKNLVKRIMLVMIMRLVQYK